MELKDLHEALGGLDAKYVEEALDYKRRRRSLLPAAAAACAALAIFAAWLLARPGSGETAPSLPLLELGDGFSGMGYEGYLAYDISELVSANPWSPELELEALPVFKSGVSRDAYGRPAGGDEAKMRARLIETARRFGIPEDELDIACDGESASAKARGISFSVDCQLTVWADFETPEPLPEEYSFTHRSSTYADCEAAAGYLLAEYGELLGMDEPRADIYGGDYNIYGEQGYGIAFYDGGEGPVEDILGFNFSRAVFYCNDAGELSGIRFYNYDLSQKLGDYPIIGPGEALELLCGGRYITSSPCEFPGRDSVRRAELIYRTSEWDENYLPYYRFYAELPDTGNAEAEALGLRSYAAYYVPAVAEEYLDALPLWEGGFN